MKKLSKLIAYVLITAMLSGCARGCQNVERQIFDNKAHKIKITHYSCGEIIGQWEIYGIVNSSESSDGYYFYHNNKLIEISGTVRIQYLD